MKTLWMAFLIVLSLTDFSLSFASDDPNSANRKISQNPFSKNSFNRSSLCLGALTTFNSQIQLRGVGQPHLDEASQVLENFIRTRLGEFSEKYVRFDEVKGNSEEKRTGRLVKERILGILRDSEKEAQDPSPQYRTVAHVYRGTEIKRFLESFISNVIKVDENLRTSRLFPFLMESVAAAAAITAGGMVLLQNYMSPDTAWINLSKFAVGFGAWDLLTGFTNVFANFYLVAQKSASFLKTIENQPVGEKIGENWKFFSQNFELSQDLVDLILGTNGFVPFGPAYQKQFAVDTKSLQSLAVRGAWELKRNRPIWGLIDFLYSGDPSTGEPMLVVTLRLSPRIPQKIALNGEKESFMRMLHQHYVEIR